MSALGDLIVRLKLKHEDYERGLKKAKTKTDSFGSQLGKAWKAVGIKIAAATAAIAGFIAGLSKIAHASQGMGDAWDRAVSGMKARWDTFMAAVSSGDFSNIGQRMNAAAEAARNMYDAEDALAEAQRAYNIASAETLRELAKEEVAARNQKLSLEERIKATQRVIDINREQAKITIDSNRNAAKASLDQWLAVADGLKEVDITEEMRDDVVEFTKWLGSESGAMDIAKQYHDIQDSIRSTQKDMAYFSAHGMNTKPQEQELERLRRKAEEVRKEFNKTGTKPKFLDWFESYQNTNSNPLFDKISKYVSAWKQADAQADVSTKRMQTLQNSLIGQAKSIKELLPLLELLKEGFAETYQRETSADFVGPMSPEVARIYNMVHGGGGNNNGGGGHHRTQYDVFSGNLSKMRSLYEQYNRFLTSTDAETREVGRRGLEELAKNGATYLEWLEEQREKYTAKSSKNKYDLQILQLLNDEIAKLTQMTKPLEFKVDDTELSDLDDIIDDVLTFCEEPIEVELIADPHGLFETLEEYYEKVIKKTQELNEDLRHAMVDGLADSMNALADQVAGLEDINPGAVIQALLDPIAEVAIQAGKITMMQGLAVEAFKESLASLNGIAAIAAGAGLIAAGAAAKAGLKALANSRGSNVTSVSSGYNGTSNNSSQTIQTELTIYVSGRISGSDIILSGQRTLNNWGR